jgi:chemotaxis protein methyltransferase WspC
MSVSVKPSGIVERLLAERIGLDPSSVGEGLIARGVHARMAALGLRSKGDYERALLDRGDEVQALVEEVVVPESWFFRDDRPFQVLDRFARSGWLTDPSRPPLTALSIPCAGGEEPYSIAMTLLETGLPGHRFRVDAVDISARALARAIAGVYGSNSFREAASPLRSTYFREQNGAFTLDLAVRSTVRFHLGNLLDPSLFADRPPFDVVFCRNVLIYLDDHARIRAFATLARLIVDGGLLFLGHADRIDRPEGSPFEPTGDKGSFAYRKEEVRAKKAMSARRKLDPVSLAGQGGGTSLPPSPLVGEDRGGGPHYHRSREPASSNVTGGATPPLPNPPPRGGREPEGKIARSKGGATSPHPNPPPQGGRGPEKRGPEKKKVAESAPAEPLASILDRASSLADLGRYDEATALVEALIRDGGANARAFFLLGLIAQAAGARDRAEAHYLKAIYLDSQQDEALLALALLARRKGDIVAEATYRRRAERVLARKVVP